MRMHLLIASVAILALAVAPAMAAPGWLSLDGSLSGDWGVDWGTDGVPTNPAEWAPGPNVWYIPGDDVVTATNSGGEWYDIEALYLRFDKVNATTQYMSWALVTSYAGNEAYAPYNDIRDTPYTAAGYSYNPYPYRRNPVVALDFNTPETSIPTWDWGLIMAANYDWTASGSTFDFTNSKGLTDPVLSTWDHNPGSFDPTLASFSGADAAVPELWNVGAGGWRSGRSVYGFPMDPPELRPIDFDTRASYNSQVSSATGSAVAKSSYVEGSYNSDLPPGSVDMGGQVPGQSSWHQRNNWVWEGYIEFPVAEFDFDAIESVQVHYGMWCANNHTSGDSVYGANPPTPELSTWALLLATGAIGGWARRRRKV